MLSVIIPTLNASEGLETLLPQIGADIPIIISDGGSDDLTLHEAMNGGARLALGSKGRGSQLARGARLCAMTQPRNEAGTSHWYLFFHADVRLDENWDRDVNDHIHAFPNDAGYFRFGVDQKGFWPTWLGAWTRIRCLLFNLPYGDQGLLISKDLYERIGGYEDWVLFEDVALVRAIKRHKGARLRALKTTIYTNPKRYEKGGYIRRPLKNLSLLIRFFLGARPEVLAARYQ